MSQSLVSIASFLTFSYFAAICCFAPLICSPSDAIFERSAAFCRAFRSTRALAAAGFGGREAKVKGIKYNKVNYAADNGIVATSGLGSDEATGVANKQKWVGDYKQNKGTAELSVYVSGEKVTMVGIDGPGAKQWSAAGKIDGDKIVMDLSKPAPNNKEGAKPDGKEGVEMTRTKLGASFEGAEYSKVFYGPFVNRLLEVGYGY